MVKKGFGFDRGVIPLSAISFATRVANSSVSISLANISSILAVEVYARVSRRVA